MRKAASLLSVQFPAEPWAPRGFPVRRRYGCSKLHPSLPVLPSRRGLPEAPEALVPILPCRPGSCCSWALGAQEPFPTGPGTLCSQLSGPDTFLAKALTGWIHGVLDRQGSQSQCRGGTRISRGQEGVLRVLEDPQDRPALLRQFPPKALLSAPWTGHFLPGWDPAGKHAFSVTFWTLSEQFLAESSLF